MLKQKNFISAIILFLSFIIWTVSVSVIDVKTIGPLESAVGFATINQFVQKMHKLKTELRLYEKK